MKPLTLISILLIIELQFMEKALRQFAFLVGSIVMLCASSLSQAQSLPPEVASPYVAYTEAMEENRVEDAKAAALQAWRAAERANVDTITTATLSDNYAALALRTGEFDSAVEAYRATAELLEAAGSDASIISETWVYAAAAALSGRDFSEARRCADTAGDIAENAETMDSEVRVRLLFNSRAIQAVSLWSNGNLRAAYRRANEAIEVANGRDFSQNAYFPILTFVLGATNALIEDDEEAAYWLTVAYHYMSAQRTALGYWSEYARDALDDEQRERLLDRLAQVELPELILTEDEQARADQAAQRAALTASGFLVDTAPVSRQAPEYPRAAARAGVEGTALLRFTINEDGRAEDIVVLASIPYREFGEAGARAIRGWQYSPAMRNGEPVSREGVITEFNFTLED